MLVSTRAVRLSSATARGARRGRAVGRGVATRQHRAGPASASSSPPIPRPLLPPQALWPRQPANRGVSAKARALEVERSGPKSSTAAPKWAPEIVVPEDTPPEGYTRVKFSISRDMEFGQHIILVGGHPILGNWSTDEGVPMDWVEGNRWEVEMELPQWHLIEYKYVVRCGWHDGANTIWSGGSNCLIATNQSQALNVEDTWVPIDDFVPEGEDPIAAATAEAARVFTERCPGSMDSRDMPHTLVPSWAEDAIFYAIYPLGAFGCPFINDQESAVVPRIAAIRNQYDHLESLGVTAVYFSPLFESETHGYDTIDYFKIDRRLGDVKLFKEIVDELHQRGIRVVLDGVFNHTGRDHEAFKAVANEGPRKSEFANWYSLGAKPQDYEGWCVVNYDEDSGFAYDCWEGHAQLPRLNLSEKAVRQHIFEVAKFWLDDIGVDGWRLDVAHEISPDFWREFRQVCDSIKPDVLLVGEMIHGNYRGWVGPDRLHSGTNYQLSRALWSSLVESNYDELYTAIQRENKLYYGLTLLNFVSNHDVIRLESVLTKPAHNVLATAALLLLPGIPCIYYGDEFGVEGKPGGGVDEACGGDDALRGPMLDPTDPTAWPEVGKERLKALKKLIAIRQANPAFTKGVLNVQGIEYTNESFIFCRATPEQIGVVVFNSSDHEIDPWPEVKVPAADGTIFTDIWSEDEEDKEATFEVYGGKIYVGPMHPNSVRILVLDLNESGEPPAAAAEAVNIPLTAELPAATEVLA